MLHEFFASWSLFAPTYLAGFLMAATLAMIGVVLVIRQQMFHGAAMAQASTLGVAFALGIGLSDHAATIMAVGSSILASWFVTRIHRHQTDSPESYTAWLFLLGSAASVLLVAHSPHGLEEIHRLLSSSIMGVHQHDLVLFSLLLIITAFVVLFFRYYLMVVVIDPLQAIAMGIQQRLWSNALALWIGLVVGLAIHIAGTLFVFGLLVLPALLAKRFVRNVAPLFWLAPIAAVLCTLCGFIFANYYDFPPAQMIVGGMALALALCFLLKVR